MEEAVSEFKPRLLKNIKEFLEKCSDGTHYDYKYRCPYVNKKKVFMGITFTYRLSINETIEVDLSLSPKFSDHHDMLSSMQGATKQKRKL